MKSREDYYNEFLKLSDEEMIKQITKDKNTYNKQITRLSEKFGDSVLLSKYDRRISKDMIKNLKGYEKENLKRSLASDHAKLRWNQGNAKTYNTKGMESFLKKGIEGSGVEMHYEERNGKRVAIYEFAGRELSKDEVSDFYDKLHELQESGKLDSIAYGSYDIKEVLNLYMEKGYDSSVSNRKFKNLLKKSQKNKEKRDRDEFDDGMKNQSIDPSMPF